jgi:hypothetical protein
MYRPEPGRNKHLHWASKELDLRVAEHLLDLRVEQRDPSAIVNDDNPVGRQGEEISIDGVVHGEIESKQIRIRRPLFGPGANLLSKRLHEFFSLEPLEQDAVGPERASLARVPVVRPRHMKRNDDAPGPESRECAELCAPVALPPTGVKQHDIRPNAANDALCVVERCRLLDP